MTEDEVRDLAAQSTLALVGQVHQLEQENGHFRARIAELESRLAFLGGTRHIIDVVYGGWTIQHPLTCRPNPFDCEVSSAAVAAETFPEPGRYFCRVDGVGDLVIEEAVS